MKKRHEERLQRYAAERLQLRLEKEVRLHQQALSEAARPNIEVATASINESTDEKWLRGFRTRMAPAGEAEIVAAIDSRLAELDEMRFRSKIRAVGSGLDLRERVQESLRVYEAFLARKHGRNVPASRTRTMIQRWGEKEAVRRTVTNLDMSTGLELLAK